MAEPFLIAHVVRGEPAFDIAERLRCPKCNGVYLDQISERGFECKECDEGYWWIIPTSGHRARPYWFALLTDIDDTYDLTIKDHTFIIDATRGITGEMSGPSLPPEGWPDHYPCNTHSPPTKVDQLSAEALLKDLGL